jgi:chromosome segregation ATPase
MTKWHTLTDCYELLQVDPKTFRRWIEKAGIQPQVSKADDRVKYLTEAQLQTLAMLHERQLAPAGQKPPPRITPGSYKLLLEQVSEVRDAVEHASEQVREAWRTIDELRATYEQELTDLRTAIEEKSRAWENLSALQQQQDVSLESLTTLVNNQQKILEQHQSEQMQHLSKQEEHIRELEDKLEQCQQSLQHFGQELGQHRALQQGMSQQLRRTIDRVEQQVEALTRQVETLTQDHTQDVTRLAEQLEAMSGHVEMVAQQVNVLSSTWQQQVGELATTLQTEIEQRQQLQERAGRPPGAPVPYPHKTRWVRWGSDGKTRPAHDG